MMSWGGRGIKKENDWKFQSYKWTNLSYDILCESINSDQEEKEGDLLNGNLIINLNNLITNIDKFSVQIMCTGMNLQIKLEEGKYRENFVAYVEDYFHLTPSDEQKGIRELHQDFKKQKSHCQNIYHQDSFCVSISYHTNGLASTI